MNKLTDEQLRKLRLPLPQEAVKAHPTRTGMSSIKSIYVTERLNEVFGVGGWQIKADLITHEEWNQKTRNGDRAMYTALMKTTLIVPEYGISYECYASSDNDDEGDAAKGSITDSITKISSWLGIGADVYKGSHGSTQAKFVPPVQVQVKQETPKEVVKPYSNLVSEPQLKLIHVLINQKGADKAELKKKFGITESKNMSKKQASELIDYLNSIKVNSSVPTVNHE